MTEEGYHLPFIRVTCAVIQKGGRILAAQRSSKMKLPFKWEFPGGKLETDESEESCIAREIKEELGIEIGLAQKLETVFHDYGDFRIELIPFLADWQSGEIILREHSAYRWLTVSEFGAVDWAEADVPVLSQLKNLNLRP